MRAVAKRPGEPGKVITIDNDLKALQDYVGGYIETYTISHNVTVICNEEGRILDLPYNVTFVGHRFCGPILIVGVKGDDFTDCPAPGFIMDVINKGVCHETR